MSILKDLVISLIASFTISKFEISTKLYDNIVLLTALEAFFNSFLSISKIITFAPDYKNFLAIPRSKHCAPPVINAILFFKSNWCKNKLSIR